MTNQNIIQYPIDLKHFDKVENYLGNNSVEYAFSHEKGDEGELYFIDNQNRIFAILNPKKNNLQLANYASSNVKLGIENILKLGDKN